MPPVPDEAQQDELLFAIWYCGEYGISETSCSYLASLWGLDVPNPMEDSEKTLVEFGEEVAYLVLGDYIECANDPGLNSACGWSMVDLFGGKVLKWGGDLWSAIRAANKACNSFVAGTLVVMADGPVKPIEEVKPGEKVLSTDFLTGEASATTVASVLVTDNRTRDLVDITIEADGDGSSDGVATATAGHPIWTASHVLDEASITGITQWTDIRAGWQTARSLEAGSWLHSSAGTWVQVADVSHRVEHSDTYNLTIAQNHTYYVLAGSASILVHNEDLPCLPGVGDFPRKVVNTNLSHIDQPRAERAGFRITVKHSRRFVI